MRGPYLLAADPDAGQCHPNLSDVGQPIDVVDLCINHFEGIKQVEQMAVLGIPKVFIQPGAASPEILALCNEKQVSSRAASCNGSKLPRPRSSVRAWVWMTVDGLTSAAKL